METENQNKLKSKDMELYLKTWREDHKEDIKKWREDHKEYFKEYYIKNKEKVNMKHICPSCQGSYSKCHLSRHLKSKKHIKSIQIPDTENDTTGKV